MTRLKETTFLNDDEQVLVAKRARGLFAVRRQSHELRRHLLRQDHDFVTEPSPAGATLSQSLVDSRLLAGLHIEAERAERLRHPIVS